MTIMKTAKKIYRICLLPALIAAVTPVYAIDTYLKSDNRDITVLEGKTILPEGSKLTVSIFKAGKNYKNIETFEKSSYEIIPFAEVLKTNTDGSWRVEWENTSAGYYDVYVSDGIGIIDKCEEPQFITSGMEKKYKCIESGSKKQLEDLFSDKNNVFSFVSDDVYKDKTDDSARIGTALYNIREELDDKTKIINYTNLAAYMAALSEQKDAKTLDLIVSELERCGFTLENKETYGASSTSEEIRGDMAISLFDAYLHGMKEFNKKFTDSLILSGIYKSFNWRDAMNYLDILENDDYKKEREKVAKAVAGKKYTLAGLEAAIKNAVNPEPGKNISGGGGSGGGISGGTNTKKEIKPNDGKEKETNSKKAVVFSDVEEEYWAYDAINYLRWKEILNGDTSGRFNPENNVTRCEIVKMLCCVFDKKPNENGEQVFFDVEPGMWFFGYVNTAAKLNLVLGDENQNFNPEQNITREDLAVIIHRFCENGNIKLEGSELNFLDNADIAEYAKAAVGCMADNRIVFGNGDNRFMPKQYATRAEAAVILYRVLNISERSLK